jgi:hypothetical protein
LTVGPPNSETFATIVGQILDAVIDQRHQRRQLVRGGAQPGLQDRHHPLAEQQGIVGVGQVPLLPLQVVAPTLGARTDFTQYR